MTLSTTRKVLLITTLMAVFTLAVLSSLLKSNITLDMYLNDRPLLQRTVSGKLVARSQYNFHHILEQWESPDSLGKHTKLKERFIEDGRVIREEIEYNMEGENENKQVSTNDPNQHINISKDLLADGESKHSRDSRKAHSVFNSSSDLNRTRSGNVASTIGGKVDKLQTAQQGGHGNTSGPLHTTNATKKSDKYIDTHQSSSVSKPTTIGGGGQPPVKMGNESNKQTLSNGRRLLSKPSGNSNASVKMGNESNKHIKPLSNKDKFSKHSDYLKASVSDNQAKKQVIVHPSRGDTDKPGTVRVIDSKGRAINVVKHTDDHRSEGGRLQEAKMKRNAVYLGEAPPLKLPAKDDDGLELDPKYANLPLSVRKKIAALRKEKLQRIKYTKLIRERCHDRKFCLRPQYKERHLHDDCFYKSIQQEKAGIELNPCNCKLFMAPTTIVNGRRVVSNRTHPRVALVSLPGSGNTWVRGLLEMSTGYCTGSMWCDPMLRARQFCGEGLRADTLVIKNHDPTIRWYREKRPVNTTELNKPMFSSAIFIHRNPYEATIAEWNRALGFKVRNATKHNLTVAGIGPYNSDEMKNDHVITFGAEAFGTFLCHTCM